MPNMWSYKILSTVVTLEGAPNFGVNSECFAQKLLSVTGVRRGLPQDRDWSSTCRHATINRGTLAQSVKRLLCVNWASEVMRGKRILYNLAQQNFHSKKYGSKLASVQIDNANDTFCCDICNLVLQTQGHGIWCNCPRSRKTLNNIGNLKFAPIMQLFRFRIKIKMKFCPCFY